MFNFFAKGIEFIRENPKILYSVILIVLIPFALFYNTYFSIKAFQKNLDYTLQSHALLAESILSGFVADFISNQQALQEKITKIAQENPEIGRIWVAFPEGDELKVSASSKAEEVGREIKGDPLTLAWAKNQAIAYSSINDSNARFWEVVKPLQDSSGKKIAAIGLALSLKDIDVLTKEAVYRAYVAVAIAIALSLFLIFHHTQLFGYVVLSRKLQEIDRMKDDFIRMATHELQTPIANIRGYTEALKEEIGATLNSGQTEFLNRISISSKNLADLINDILEVSRIEQGRLDFAPQAVIPYKVIQEVIDEMKVKAEEKKLKLIFNPGVGEAYISANHQRFKQIIVNLISNALKYTPSGQIEISAAIDAIKKRYTIFVKDTGLGISAEEQKRLFERFYRVKTEKTADISGTGLGLWITKRLCEEMNGSIFIESMEGVGTKVAITFPIMK